MGVQVAQLASDGNVEIGDQRIQVEGDLAYEVGIERGKFKLAGHPVVIEQRVTNVYRREAGAWRIVHHHTDVPRRCSNFSPGSNPRQGRPGDRSTFARTLTRIRTFR
jgi:ketosteroid isomerase-like protein